MTTVDDDPFARPDVVRVKARTDVISRGRYMLPWKDGSHKSRGFQRVTNLVAAFSDQFGLRVWELGEVLQGVSLDPTLYAALLSANLHEMSKEERNAWVKEFIEHCKDASGGNRGAKHGNQRHAAVEAHHAGLPMGHQDPLTRRDLVLYDQALKRAELIPEKGMQERRVLVESLEVVGTLDNVLYHIPTKTYRVGDLKTQRRFWTWLEISAQLACYARGDAMWEPDADGGGRWVDMPKVSLDVAHVLWMPRDGDHVDVWDVDINEGWEIAKLARQVVLKRSIAKSTARPLARISSSFATDIEKMVARFAMAETLEDGRRLVAEAKDLGLWREVVSDAAKAAHNRIAIPA